MSTTQGGPSKNQEGLRLVRLGDYEGAIAAFTEAIAENPNSVEAYRSRAEAYRKLGKELKADADLKKARTLTQTIPQRRLEEQGVFKVSGAKVRQRQSKNQEGLRLVRTGDYEGAVAAFSEAIADNPNSSEEAYRSRAEAYRKLGREREADADLEKVGVFTRGTAQRHFDEQIALEFKGAKVRQWTMGLLCKYGSITMGPREVTFRRGNGQPEVRILTDHIIAVAAYTPPPLIDSFLPTWAQLVIEYTEPGTARTRKVFLEAQASAGLAKHIRQFLIHLIGEIGEFFRIEEPRSEEELREERRTRDRWVHQIQSFQRLAAEAHQRD